MKIEIKAFECNMCGEVCPLFEAVTVEIEPGEGMTCQLCEEEDNLSDLIHQTQNWHTKEPYTPEQMELRKECSFTAQARIINILKRRLMYK